jgi:hypothetical protein
VTLVEEFALGWSESERLGDLWTRALVRYVERERLRELVPTEDWYPPSIFFQGMKYVLFGDPSLPLAGRR